MGPDIDIYVFVRDRQANTVRAFLDRFLPSREPLMPDVEAFYSEADFPTGTYPIDTLISDAQLKHDLRTIIYYRNLCEEPLEYAILSYTRDGATIFGLSVHWDYPDIATEMLTSMRSHFGVTNGYLFTEDYPRGSEEEFREREMEYKNEK